MNNDNELIFESYRGPRLRKGSLIAIRDKVSAYKMGKEIMKPTILNGKIGILNSFKKHKNWGYLYDVIVDGDMYPIGGEGIDWYKTAQLNRGLTPEDAKNVIDLSNI